jgi:hypothetical protein
MAEMFAAMQAEGRWPSDTPEEQILRMRDWIAAGNQWEVLDAVRDLRDSFGFPAAEEYGTLLKEEAETFGH